MLPAQSPVAACIPLDESGIAVDCPINITLTPQFTVQCRISPLKVEQRQTGGSLCRGGPRAGKIEGLQAGRTKCAVRYSMEELFWLNATVFYLRVSLSPRDIPTRLPTRSLMQFWMPA